MQAKSVTVAFYFSICYIFLVNKEKKRITAIEAAEILGVTPGRVRKLIMDGIIKDVVKFGRDNAIAEDEIKKLKETDRPTGRPPKEKTEAGKKT